MTVHLTVPGVLAAMTAAVQERGREYVYQPSAGSDGYCLYVWDGCASCLVGDTLARCGVPLERMGPFEGRRAEPLLAELFDSGVVTYDQGVSLVLGAAQAAQAVQDGYAGAVGTWGEALDAAAVAAQAVAS